MDATFPGFEVMCFQEPRRYTYGETPPPEEGSLVLGGGRRLGLMWVSSWGSVGSLIRYRVSFPKSHSLLWLMGAHRRLLSMLMRPCPLL